MITYFQVYCISPQFLFINLRNRILFYFSFVLFPTFFSLSYSARAAITKYQYLGGLNNKHLLSHSSRGHKSKSKAPSGLVYGENSLLGLQTFSLCPHMAFLLCARGERKKVSLSVISSSSKGIKFYQIRVLSL